MLVSNASASTAPARTPIPTAIADALADYDDAKALVLQHQKASISWLQRQMRVGYNVAARHIELMELEGVVSAPDHVGRRTVLQQADGTLQKLAEDLHANGARIRIDANGDAQMTIPVDLPEAHRAADERYRLLVERIQRLEEEKKGIGDDIKDVYNELKATGYDAKVTRQIIRLLKMRPDDRRDMEAVLETYKNALGID